MRVRLAIAQMGVAVGRPEENLARAGDLAGLAADQGADLLLLPELWLHGYDLARAGEHARAFAERWQGEWAALAQRTGLLMAGSVLALNEEGRPVNCALLLSPQGEVLAHYHKVHRFGPMGETRYLAAGRTFPVFDLPWGRTALAVCYDLRFPEPFRRYALEGVALVLLVAQWPAARRQHWRTLLRARAIENQFFLAACNRVGRDPDGTRFGGYSAVLDPWGKVLTEGRAKETLLQADLDLEEVVRVRESFPVLRDRRPALY